MAATTVSVSESTRRKLMMLKAQEGARSMDELLERILIDHRKMRFIEASNVFRERLREKGVRFEDLVS